MRFQPARPVPCRAVPPHQPKFADPHARHGIIGGALRGSARLHVLRPIQMIRSAARFHPTSTSHTFSAMETYVIPVMTVLDIGRTSGFSPCSDKLVGQKVASLWQN